MAYEVTYRVPFIVSQQKVNKSFVDSIDKDA